MKHEQDGWPEKFKLFEPLEYIKKLGHLVFDQLRYEVPSEHHGGGPLLDKELYDKTVIHTHVDRDTVQRTVVSRDEAR